MAPEINNSAACKAVLTAVLEVIGEQVEDGATPIDVAHALTFILCIYKFRFNWTTEQLLSLYEGYITKMERALLESDEEPPDPYGEA